MADDVSASLRVGLTPMARDDLRRLAADDDVSLAFVAGAHGADRADALGLPIATLVDPRLDTACAAIGRGAIVHEGTIIGSDVTIGAFSSIGAGAFLSHDVVVGEYAVLEPRVVLSGLTALGSPCAFRPVG